jgi:hypothetical protein
MEQYRCAFSHPLIGDEFGCRCAQQVTRREGPDVCCTSMPAHHRCTQLLQRMKTQALPALGVADDLLEMPHSTQVKIQNGGLLGLQRLLYSDLRDADRVPDVDALVCEAIEYYGGHDAIPVDPLAEAICSYKLKRRRGRKR